MESREGCCGTMVTRPSLERHQSKSLGIFLSFFFSFKPGVVAHTCNSGTGKAELADHKFEVGLGYMVF